MSNNWAAVIFFGLTLLAAGGCSPRYGDAVALEKQGRLLNAARAYDAFARTRPSPATTTTSPPFSVTDRTGVRSWMTTPAASRRSRMPAASRAGCTVAASG